MDKQKKKDKIFINKNAGDVAKGIEMFNKSMTFNTQSSAQEELNQRVANNNISSEETYDILNHISELRDEAEKEDDHNNPRGAIELYKEADKLQETKTKKTTIRECLNKMDLQASDDGFRGITLVDLYEACTLTKDDKNYLIKMLQTTDDAEKVREFLSNKCEFEDIPEDDIDSEVQLECTKSDWEKLNDLDEGYQQGDEQVLDPDSEEYKKFEKIANLLNEANIIYTSGHHKGERAYFYVDDVYLDFSSDWKWTTIVREDNVQVLSPADWLSIINEESTPEEIVNKIVTDKYSGLQFANESITKSLNDKMAVKMSRDDFDKMCREGGILKGLNGRDYTEVQDSFYIGYENFDAAVNDLWAGDDGYYSRDWYADLLKKYTNSVNESLKESLNLNEAKNIINVLNKNLRVRFKHSAGGIFSLDRTPFNTDIFDELIKNNYKMIGDILEEQGLKYDISEDAYISKDENLYVTIYGDTSTVIVQFEEMESESLKESPDDSTKDLNRYEFLVKRYGHEADRETITAVSLEDAEDQLNSDGHVEYWDYLQDFNYDIDESLNEDTQLKFDYDMINDIDILHQWEPEEVEKILDKHGANPNNDNWIDGLDLPAAYDEIMSTFRDKYSDYDEIDYDVAKVLGLVEESLKAKNQNEAKEILYVIKDSHGNQLSKPNADDSELWDRVASMEARGRRGLRVVVYTGKKESLAEDKGQPRSNRYTTYFNRIKRAIEKGDEETLKRTKEAIMYAPAKELKNSEAAELMNMIKNRKITESASTNYGGAYDIADDQYFTREELNEFGEDVVDNLNSLAYSKAELESIFIENNIIEITVTWDGNEITVEQPIDMRRIRKPKDLDKYRVRVISKMKPELEELGFDFGPHFGDYELSESEEDHKEAKWERLLTKSVNDSDGFLTDYSMWYNDSEKRWVFIFGDSDIYDPTNTDPDWETENPEEAREWFLDYKGFEDDEDLDENKTMNEAREYYILPVENLIGSERRELGYYDLEMIGRKGLVTYIEGTYPDLSDYARNVLDFDLEEDDPMLTLSSEWDEELDEDVVKQGNKWVNKGKEGTHGTFKTKKDALKQTRAMYAKGYKG